MSPMWWIPIGTAIFSVGLITTLKLLDALARPPVNGSLRAMIGRALGPIGARAGQVELGGEMWSARSHGEAIGPGRWVRVLDRRGHTLVVAAVETASAPARPGSDGEARARSTATTAGRRRAGRTAGWTSDPGRSGVGPRRLGKTPRDSSSQR